jgi:hypothetical protein
MSIPYRRCCYINDQGLQCETWFEANTDSKLCAPHSEIISPSSNGHSNEAKIKYIDLVNEQGALCAKMSLDELDIHIAGLEKLLEEEKARLYAARAKRTQKLDDLSEEERKVRRAIKVTRSVEEKEKKPKKATLASDPVKYMMQKFNLTEDQAKKMLGDD